MSTEFKLSSQVSRHLVRAVLLVLLASQFALAEHLHLELEQNSVCSVCVVADNSLVASCGNGLQPPCFGHIAYQPPQAAQYPLAAPAFNHLSRAPPTH